MYVCTHMYMSMHIQCACVSDVCRTMNDHLPSLIQQSATCSIKINVIEFLLPVLRINDNIILVDKTHQLLCLDGTCVISKTMIIAIVWLSLYPYIAFTCIT